MGKKRQKFNAAAADHGPVGPINLKNLVSDKAGLGVIFHFIFAIVLDQLLWFRHITAPRNMSFNCGMRPHRKRCPRHPLAENSGLAIDLFEQCQCGFQACTHFGDSIPRDRRRTVRFFNFDFNLLAKLPGF
jgi:hypothetical protein